MEILKKLFKNEKESGKTDFTQTENEALIDLLLLAIYADNKLNLAEDRILQSEFDKLHWSSGTSLDYYISEATSRARLVRSDPVAQKEFLEFVAERFTSRESKLRAMDLLEKLIFSDGVEESEKAFIENIKESMGV